MTSALSAFPILPVDSQPDESLVALAQNGDSRAFEELSQRHRDGTYRLALRIVERPEDAEDIVQDVWLSVFTHLGHFRAEASFRTWLHRIAYNRSVQWLRFQGRSALGRADEEYDETRLAHEVDSSAAKTPEDLALQKERRATLGVLMGKLAGKYRRALTLWAIDSKSIDQVSAELQISYGAAKTRIHRARHQFIEAAQDTLAEGPEKAA